jgi:hypothetical protein
MQCAQAASRFLGAAQGAKADPDCEEYSGAKALHERFLTHAADFHAHVRVRFAGILREYPARLANQFELGETA